MLEAYGMKSLSEYIEDFENETVGSKTFYQTFLEQTDYICNKIVEGVATWEEYAEEKIARGFAREQLESID